MSYERNKLKLRKEYQDKYGKFRMPNVKLPKILNQSLPEIEPPKFKVPFKLRVIKLWGEDKAFMRYKENKLFKDKISRAAQMMILPDIKKRKVQDLNIFGK